MIDFVAVFLCNLTSLSHTGAFANDGVGEKSETWAGIPLTPFRAYGFRLYQNNSQLLMHVDKLQTHIVSFILHIDSSDDAEPWPIVIEDLQGRTHEVTLTPGDMVRDLSIPCVSLA